MTTANRILVVDDEPAIRRLLRTALERVGHAVSEAGNAADALAVLTADRPQVVLLDLGLPDRDGLELVPLMRARSDATILVVSARDATDLKVAALDLGAADYITKPFDTDELLARVRAALRHRLVSGGGRTSVRAGPILIDLLDRRVLRDDAAVHLTPKEYEVLTELARYPGRVVTHAHLLRTVWPHETDGQVGYLRVVVRTLRGKLEADPSAPTLIVNELGVGYRLMGSD
ncbi:response regulator transcription factor [Sphingomonas prati]|uniref:Two-component system KDP operon response regulator KdpE n=1 Tax=Sphingomonas prati TaxID=1843237 RepID=A0A7W9BTE9_9SPHN|nr:response regulator transcription factor [Sphingomonas prati]MBB5729609.1 two-component system KDP operon response regulator KdpE [Sphingomonas prati]GGE76146.1 DNA-binding response regulator [Sphingomonas prati]